MTQPTRDSGAELAWHIVMRLEDDRVIAPTAEATRSAARVLLETGGGRGLVAFRIADTHIHAVLAVSRNDAGTFARTAEARLHAHLPSAVSFAPARIRPVLDQAHLYNTFRYILRQRERHGLLADPHHDGSSLPELLGLRAVSAEVASRVRQLLPRIRAPELQAQLGLKGHADSIRPDQLGVAAAAALALPNLKRRTHDAARAKLAAVHVARACSRPIAETADLLELASRHIRRLRDRSPEPHLVAVVIRQLHLRSMGAGSTEGDPLPSASLSLAGAPPLRHNLASKPPPSDPSDAWRWT